jgi:YfiH family protein
MQQVNHAKGLRWFQSDLLAAAGVVHAFTTRRGGVSPAPFDSLNLGPTSTLPAGIQPDEPDRIEENYRLLQACLGCPDHRRAWVRQVHGCQIIAGTGACAEHPEADALWTDQPGVLLTIRVADCLPVLLASRDGGAVAAAHAGWRGVVSGVLGRTVECLHRDAGVHPGSLLAAIGPAISVTHFEVGPEVADAFEAAGLAPAVHRQGYGPKPHVDLAAAARLQLLAAGLGDDAIDLSHLCTVSNPDFYSHRRDQGLTGRFAGVIATRPSR